ncbi:MAG: hypothetical protein QW478_03800 [Candidatus Micrarchaeaceae archaeon]
MSTIYNLRIKNRFRYVKVYRIKQRIGKKETLSEKVFSKIFRIIKKSKKEDTF